MDQLVKCKILLTKKTVGTVKYHPIKSCDDKGVEKFQPKSHNVFIASHQGSKICTVLLSDFDFEKRFFRS